MNRLVVIGIAVAVVLFVGGWLIVKSPEPQTNPPPPEKVGALTGPDIPYPYISVGGLQRYSANVAFASATTTLCSIQAPAATSTLVHAAMQWTTPLATTTPASPTRYGIFKTTTGAATASTTAIDAVQILNDVSGVAKSGQLLASTTPGLAGTTLVFGPNEWLIFKVNNSGAGDYRGYAPSGECTAKWNVL